MKKNKGKQVDLLYNTNKQSPKKSPKKVKTKNSKKRNEETINLGNEIIIGMTPKKEIQKKKSTKASKQKRKTQLKLQKGIKNKNGNNKKSSKKTRAFKWTTLISLGIIVLLVITAIIIFMLSDVFSVKQIIIKNNEKISAEEIISLSGLTTEENIFKISSKSVEERIKQNAYIASIKLKRNLSGTVTIEVKERKATYMLEFINAFVYVDNQGYMLEKSNEPINEAPILTGLTTKVTDIDVGKRLELEDLKKLSDTNQIMETARNQKIGNLITKIDISSSKDYLLTISSEEKVIHFADASNINTKVLLIISLLEQEKGNKGEIFLNNIKKAVFRESVGVNNII